MIVRELSSLPAIAPLLARAGAGAIPGSAKLPFLPGGGRDSPRLTLIVRDVAVAPERLRAYEQLCGYPQRQTLPAAFPHLLAFPLQLALMTDPSFPFPPIGLVQIANQITRHRSIDAGERLTLHVAATPVDAHPRGRSFGLRTRALVGGELVWEELATNLRRGRGSDGAPRADEDPDPAALAPAGTWELPGNLGRRYAAVSGDLNPIHLHPLSARLLGFDAAIAHGMWTLGRCLAELEPRLPGELSVGAQFRRPILLPATVRYAAREAGGDGAGPARIEFGVLGPSGEPVHLLGTATQAG